MTRANIPVLIETRNELLKKKLKLQAKIGKRITWDEFLLKYMKLR